LKHLIYEAFISILESIKIFHLYQSSNRHNPIHIFPRHEEKRYKMQQTQKTGECTKKRNTAKKHENPHKNKLEETQNSLHVKMAEEKGKTRITPKKQMNTAAHTTKLFSYFDKKARGWEKFTFSCAAFFRPGRTVGRSGALQGWSGSVSRSCSPLEILPNIQRASILARQF